MAIYWKYLLVLGFFALLLRFIRFLSDRQVQVKTGTIRGKYSALMYWKYGLPMDFCLCCLVYIPIDFLLNVGVVEKLIITAVRVIALFAIFSFLWFHIKQERRLAIPIICSHCLKNIIISRDWQCPYCDHMNMRRRITDKCNNCKDYLLGFVCPYCQEYIRFDDPYNVKELKRRRYEEL